MTAATTASQIFCIGSLLNGYTISADMVYAHL